MEYSMSYRSRSPIVDVQNFYCYVCDKKFATSVNECISTPESEEGHVCIHCGSDFVELMENPTNFKPNSVSTYSSQKTYVSQENVSTDEGEAQRIVRRTIRLPSSNNFVKDVLMQLFPHVFRHVSIDRIETIRSIISTLNLFDSSIDQTNGPTDKSIIEKLENEKYQYLVEKDKYSNCPICTDNLVNGDMIIKLNCSHIFHDGCILPWLELNNSCPNCRQLLTSKP